MSDTGYITKQTLNLETGEMSAPARSELNDVVRIGMNNIEISFGNIYRKASDVEGIPYWDTGMIAEHLPMLFSVTRAKVNGHKVVKVRKCPGVTLLKGEQSWRNAYQQDAAVKAIWNNCLRAGEHPELMIDLPCGTLILTNDLSEYVLQNVASFVKQGWTIKVY